VRILNKNQPSGVKSIEIHVSLASKDGSRVVGLNRNLIIKKSDYNDKLLSTVATFGFCLLR